MLFQLTTNEKHTGPFNGPVKKAFKEKNMRYIK